MDTEPEKLADTVSAVDAGFSGAGVQRDAIPLCWVQGRSALLGSRVKRLAQGELMLCVN